MIILGEGMTREKLETYRSKQREIRELEWRLENRWKSDTLIGNDVIMDYRKGYPMPQSVVGFDYNRYEQLQDRDLHRKDKLEKECEEVEEFIDSIEKSVDRRIAEMYYVEGREKPTQEWVAKQVGYERSYISKKINEILKLSHNSQKSHL